jgi:hypothetical protein
MIGRAVRHLTPDSLRRITDGADPPLHELGHLLYCARCADLLQRYERADDLAREIARAAGAATAVPRR